MTDSKWSKEAEAAWVAENQNRSQYRPALPPRASTAASKPAPAAASNEPPPPPYSEKYSASHAGEENALASEQWRSNDPRSSSTHSLLPPSEEVRDGRRTLLAVFIHGFMGNETSFQSFPAHLHNLLSISLKETHVVHTKIYPRYKSRKAIEFARDYFSRWLEPHESPTTDVVLLGHSLGGILAAEVVLMQPTSPASGDAFRHRILGSISFDTPFLGMHPGVISSGLGSIFNPAPDPPGSKPQGAAEGSTSTASLQTMNNASSVSTYPGVNDSSTTLDHTATPPPETDANFNQPFPNDVRIPERKGWSNILHFVTKHSDGLTAATKQYVMSHLEFGGCMADYPGLKARYTKIRALEDVDDLTQPLGLGYHAPKRRVRFINYYTASTGRLKKPKVQKETKPVEEEELHEVEMQNMSLEEQGAESQGEAEKKKNIAIENSADEAGTSKTPAEKAASSALESEISQLGENSGVTLSEDQEPQPMRHIESMPIVSDDEDAPDPALPEPAEAPSSAELGRSESSEDVKFPPLPPVPEEPAALNLEMYQDKDAKKIAEKDHKRAMKAYQQALKARESAIKDRQKMIEKREKAKRKESEKAAKEAAKAAEKERVRREQEEFKKQQTINKSSDEGADAKNAKDDRGEVEDKEATEKPEKPKKDRKFCMLPPGDRCWVRVYMEGVDEVGAHCGLFFPGKQYESLVGDVGARIEQWVGEDATRRAVLEAQARA